MFWKIAWRSLAQRRASVSLTVAALAVSIMVLVGIEHIRQSARTSFARTVSGTDLIAGARSGDINLLLYSVFHLGNASNSMSWRSYREIAELPDVAWTIPLSLGDSHKGNKVLATNGDYFRHFRYGDDQALVLREGRPFQDLRTRFGSRGSAQTEVPPGRPPDFVPRLGEYQFYTTRGPSF